MPNREAIAIATAEKLCRLLHEWHGLHNVHEIETPERDKLRRCLPGLVEPFSVIILAAMDRDDAETKYVDCPKCGASVPVVVHGPHWPIPDDAGLAEHLKETVPGIGYALPGGWNVAPLTAAIASYRGRPKEDKAEKMVACGRCGKGIYDSCFMLHGGICCACAEAGARANAAALRDAEEKGKI